MNKGKRPSLIERRPTEVTTGLGLAIAVYGFLTQAGVNNAAAAVLGIAVAFIPTVISNTVDLLRLRRTEDGVHYFKDDHPHNDEEFGPDLRDHHTDPPATD